MLNENDASCNSTEFGELKYRLIKILFKEFINGNIFLLIINCLHRSCKVKFFLLEQTGTSLSLEILWGAAIGGRKKDEWTKGKFWVHPVESSTKAS